jgi:peptidoglycan/LPS O-acetylase OafA/YrhL
MGKYKVTIDVIWMFGEIGVNVFALLSGYFMIEQEKPFRVKKAFLMWMQVLFYSILTNIISPKIIEGGGIERDEILQSLFPITYRFRWYATAYFVLYLFTPYINRGLRCLRKKEYGKLILTLLILYSIWPTLLGVFDNNTETFLYYNRCLWILIMYCIAGYIRLYGIYKEKWRFFHWGVIHIITWLVLLGFIAFMPENGVSEHIKMKNTYFWPPNSIVLVVISVSLFMMFSYIKLKENVIISYIASCTFGIYLGQDMIRNPFFHKNLTEPKDLFIDMVCAFFCIAMGVLSIETLRKGFEKIIANLYDKIQIRCKK